MNIRWAGGCLCGEVRYEIVAEPVKMANCHCRSCQRWSGSAFIPLLFVPYKALQVAGSYREFPTVAASGNTIFRAFCPHCGTPLFGRNSALTRHRPVAAMTLDDPGLYHPELDMWVADAQAWETMAPELPKFPGNFW
ncbi:MAG: GFA family protein [Gammaproteobacteria bacterium]